MATMKVGVYRKYHGPVPKDDRGQPLPKSEWPKKRACRWAVRWFGAEGKRYSRSFETRKEAERFAETKQGEVRERKPDPPRDVTLEAFCREHSRTMRGQVAPGTLCDQERALEMLMRHVGASTLMTAISARHAESFVAARLASGVRVATVNKDIRTLKRLFNLAIEPRGYLTPGRNPFARIQQRKQCPKAVRFVSPEEFQQVLNAASCAWWKALFLVAYTTAARLGEILHLKWEDLDLRHSRIRIVRKDATGDSAAWEPKDHEGRVLPMPAETQEMLTRLRDECPQDCPYIFVPAKRWTHIREALSQGRWNERRTLLNNLNRRLATLRKRAGIAQFTYHDLRRSCITNWAHGLPVHVVQKLAGHSDIKTTQRYYLSVREADLEQARRIQSLILQRNPTDPKVTQSGQTDGNRPENEKGQSPK